MISPAETNTVQVNLGLIEGRANLYSQAREALASALSDMQAELESVKSRRLKSIKTLARRAAEAEAALSQAVEAAPHLFVKPRTLTLHGIKVGFRTGAGRIVWDDKETVIKLIKKHMATHADVLINTKEDPNKDGLRTLTAVELARIGCRLEGTGDEVVLAAVDGEIEKMLAKLISDMVEAATGAD